MDRSELAKLKQKQGSAGIETPDVSVVDVTPNTAVNVDPQDIYVKGVVRGQKTMKDHSKLDNLDYANSGHTGFAGIEFGTTAEWATKPTYRPEEGVLIVYTDYEEVPTEHGPVTNANFKIGNGNVYLVDLPFVDAGLRYEIGNHINNKIVHITQEEREFWNNKINCLDTEISDDLLEFTRN